MNGFAPFDLSAFPASCVVMAHALAEECALQQAASQHEMYSKKHQHMVVTMVKDGHRKIAYLNSVDF